MSQAQVARYQGRLLRRQRELVTPEGLVLPITIASRSSRAGALLMDLLLIGLVQAAVTVALSVLGLGVLDADEEKLSPVMEIVLVLWVVLMFLFRYGYFLYFELGPRGATPGKRMTGIRIAARDGGRLSVEAVIARNLLRDIEVFLPIMAMIIFAAEGGWTGFASFVWLMIFLLFPFFNRDALRAGDMVAGTWVVETPKRKLEHVMSVGEGARGRSVTTGAEYRFGDDELAVYGEYELQALERVLRDDNPETVVMVAQTICNKIGWNSGSGDERAFLEAFYAQLRAKLESGMRFGKRKADKHSAEG